MITSRIIIIIQLLVISLFSPVSWWIRYSRVALDECFSTSGLGAEWYKKARTITCIYTQMLGGRYEALPMQDCKQSPAEQNGQIETFCKCMSNTGGREDGVLHWMRGMVPQRMHAHIKANMEKKVKIWVVLWQLQSIIDFILWVMCISSTVNWAKYICIGIQYSLLNLVYDTVFSNEYFMGYTASTGSYRGTVFPGGTLFTTVTNVCGVRHSLGYRIHSDTGTSVKHLRKVLDALVGPFSTAYFPMHALSWGV